MIKIGLDDKLVRALRKIILWATISKDATLDVSAGELEQLYILIMPIALGGNMEETNG